MAKLHEINWIFNGTSEDGERSFAGRLGHPEMPSLRIDTEVLNAVFGDELQKGDGFTTVTGLSDVTMIGECFIPLINGRPARGEKRHVLRFESEEQALSALGDIDGGTVLATFNYVDLGDDCQLKPDVRKGEAHGKAVSVTASVASAQLGL